MYTERNKESEKMRSCQISEIQSVLVSMGRETGNRKLLLTNSSMDRWLQNIKQAVKNIYPTHWNLAEQWLSMLMTHLMAEAEIGNRRNISFRYGSLLSWAGVRLVGLEAWVGQ